MIFCEINTLITKNSDIIISFNFKNPLNHEHFCQCPHIKLRNLIICLFFLFKVFDEKILTVYQKALIQTFYTSFMTTK